MNQMEQNALAFFDQAQQEISALCCYIHDNPELCFEEFKSSKAISDFLAGHGFQVETGIADLPTAFRAVKDSGKPGPTVGYTCEYDALPGLGHACGHNIIGTASASAAVAAANVLEQTGGRIVVLGTPAEEGGGGKELLLRAGCMKDLDCALQCHPGPNNGARGTSLAIAAYRFIFHGKAAHASASPETGISALEAVISLFNNINAYRAYLPPNVRINGIITKGGEAANIVPHLCEASFNIRASKRALLEAITKRVIDCANGAAVSTGCTVEVVPIGVPYADMIPVDGLSELGEECFREFGLPLHVKEIGRPMASTDVGNVTYALPAIQLMFRMVDDDPTVIPHTPRFAQACAGQPGADLALRAGRVLALAGIRLLSSPERLEKIRREWEVKVAQA